MKMLGAEEEKESKRYLRRKERFRRNVIQYFQEIIDNISRRGDIHEPPTVTSHGKEAEGRRTNAEAWSKDQTQVVSSECLSERARDNPGPVPLPHRTGVKAARNQRAAAPKQPRKEESESHTLTPPPG